MRLSDLRDKRVKTTDGKALGRVHEVHCEQGRIVALMCGSHSLIERLTAKAHGRRIRWECVRKVDRDHVIVAPEEATGKPSAARTPRGTRRPSGPRSRR